MSLAEVCRQHRRLAYHAPATALAVNMHLYGWVSRSYAKGPSEELVKARHVRAAAGRFDDVAAAGRRRPCRLGHGRAGHEAQAARKHG